MCLKFKCVYLHHSRRDKAGALCHGSHDLPSSLGWFASHLHEVKPWLIRTRPHQVSITRCQSCHRKSRTKPNDLFADLVSAGVNAPQEVGHVFLASLQVQYKLLRTPAT